MHDSPMGQKPCSSLVDWRRPHQPRLRLTDLARSPEARSGKSSGHQVKTALLTPNSPSSHRLSFRQLYCPSRLTASAFRYACVQFVSDGKQASRKSTYLLNATFSPTSVHAGPTRAIFARSDFTPMTFPPVAVDPMLIMRTSPFVNLATFVCFLSSVLTPSNLRSRKKLISSSTYIDGKDPTAPSTIPTSRSALHSCGSIFVPTPINPPGTAKSRLFFSASSDTIREKMG